VFIGDCAIEFKNPLRRGSEKVPSRVTKTKQKAQYWCNKGLVAFHYSETVRVSSPTFPVPEPIPEAPSDPTGLQGLSNIAGLRRAAILKARLALQFF